mmetsp:Transcript_12889/g.19711  ORF Transcript_12889/g.19711 Transcript_12889/m.19711 type:complete len:311 (+) Transcript_12889:84-1016(+)
MFQSPVKSLLGKAKGNAATSDSRSRGEKKRGSSRQPPPVSNLFVSKVSFSGSLLTALVQEASTRLDDEDMEGFLHGYRLVHEKHVTTDFEERKETIETEISIQSYTTTGMRGLFYSHHGTEISEERYREFQQLDEDDQMEMVGWVVLRKCAGDPPSLRDAAIHASLSRRAGTSAPWLFLLINIDVSHGASTQALSYTCLQHRAGLESTPSGAGRFVSIPIEVRNANHSAAKEYRSFAPNQIGLNGGEARRMMNGMTEVYRSIPPAHVQEQEFMFDGVMEKIDEIVKDIREKEQELNMLRSERLTLMKGTS